MECAQYVGRLGALPVRNQNQAATPHERGDAVGSEGGWHRAP